MLIAPSFLAAQWRLAPETIVHVGGHHAEEFDDYLSLDWGSRGVLWVEAMEDASAVIRERIKGRGEQRVVTAVVWSESGARVDFHETSNGQSSSVLDLHDHSLHYPDIVVTRSQERVTSTLEELIDWQAMPQIGLLNLDIQGAELHALKGLGDKIKRVQAIYSEVNVEELYAGCPLLADLDQWLSDRGFTRLALELTPQGWGDGFWLRNDCLPRTWRWTLFQEEAAHWLGVQKIKVAGKLQCARRSSQS